MLLAASGGCARRRAASPAVPQPAYASLPQLMERHPNWDDLRRLAAAERQLGQLGGQSAPGDERVPDRYSLSPLVLPALPLGRFSEEKARLRATNARWLAEFATRLRAGQERGLQRLRRELEAVAEARVARLRREEEAGLFDRARSVREQQAEELLNLEIDINTLRARIAIVPPPPDRDTLEAEVRRLEARREALRQAAQTAEAQVRREMEARLARTAQNETREIDRRVAQQRAVMRRSAAALQERQRVALETTLAALAGEAGGGAERSVAGPYSIAAPFATAVRPDAALAPAERRIRDQREALQRFIREDTQAIVADAAAERGLRVTFDPGAGAPDVTAQLMDRVGGRNETTP